MLNESKLFTFLDSENDFIVHLLEGNKLISDLLETHLLSRDAFVYLQKLILTIQPMISFLKNGEGFGIYIDSESPYFRFKVETNSFGYMRTLLLPENFNEIPSKITGICRLSKTFVGRMKPYTSVIELKETSIENIIDKILKESYQVQSEVKISASTNQSIMIMKLPHLEASKKETINHVSLPDYWNNKKDFLTSVMNKGLTEPDLITSEFENNKYKFIHSKEVKFQCSCSKERILVSLLGMRTMSPDELYEEDGSLSIKCDYCKKSYVFNRDEVLIDIKKH
jgi:molecular chaperone Hsp33